MKRLKIQFKFYSTQLITNFLNSKFGVIVPKRVKIWYVYQAIKILEETIKFKLDNGDKK